ncbi:MAG: dTDP-glucose 4,6-dehydratase [Elusimicrobia bacterium]|nr:MAG: dTDP-glucose 4,6-dehydratase [Elusimicrobiota bacterium]
MTILVIGSNCFTGCHFVDALLDDPKNHVVGISRSPEYADVFLPYKKRKGADFTFKQLDIVNDWEGLRTFVDTLRPDVIINVAALSEVALSNERPLEYFHTNVDALVRLVDHVRRQDYLRRFVHISSAEIYGACAQPLVEDSVLNPSTPYAASKAAADMFLLSMIKNFDFPAILIRSTNVYGRHQQLFKIIPRTMIYLKQGKTIELHGGGTAVKSFIHVRDVVDGALAALKKNVSGVYNFTERSDRSIADVVRLVCQRMGHDFEKATRIVGERLGQDSRYFLNDEKARNELGWSPRIAFEDGIDEVRDWIETHWGEIENKPLAYVHK